MKINEIAISIRNKPMDFVLPTNIFNEQERISAGYTSLNVYLARTMQKVKTNDKDSLLENYCRTLTFFIEIADQMKWTYLLLLDDEKINNFKSKWKAKSFNIVYLITQQQLNKAYFQRDSNAFVHAWHLFIKFGLLELNLSEKEIENYFLFEE
ncbi:hypothetical protein FC40_GL000554 [Ligilactobacillus hayakitensis DSM 18933 = JCM 14209]|uniref:dUTPase n=1 Tax=Ligilactobacillus hayakitensis DSM 18933 = JCM 14209 TaxID=1423755 RepID=A0A0R1WUQ8_9LACO|nr:hypothetical protein [Ligilactobacillus hayakitensis]KRM18771.1 hypothetical protein FC40_GL000554 [Ligilactobacillus hayakitensis DSM 18933 = JCM 14209]